MGTWIITHSGRVFDYANPTMDMICIEDIAHSLSHQARFAGHAHQFYSVAEHSLLVARHLPDHAKLEGLMHDAQEAYVTDLPAPLKALLRLQDSRGRSNYDRLEDEVAQLIEDKFGLFHGDLGGLTNANTRRMIKAADLRALATEQRDLFSPSQNTSQTVPYPDQLQNPMAPHLAKREFLRMFNRLHVLRSKSSEKQS